VRRVFPGWKFRPGQKRGPKIGKTKRGQGTKLMVLADGKGVPLGVSLHSASPHEVKLAHKTLATVRGKPQHLVCDKAYDSDAFREELERQGIELVAPHRTNRKKSARQDGRALCRYQRRWERNDKMCQAFLHIACALITCNNL